MRLIAWARRSAFSWRYRLAVVGAAMCARSLTVARLFPRSGIMGLGRTAATVRCPK